MNRLGFLTFDASLNGTKILMAVDTAANTTTFDMSLIDELELTIQDENGNSYRIAGAVPLKRAHIADFRVATMSHAIDASFVDLRPPNEGIVMGGGVRIRGLLGADLLKKWNAVIDYESMTLVIRRP